MTSRAGAPHPSRRWTRTTSRRRWVGALVAATWLAVVAACGGRGHGKGKAMVADNEGVPKEDEEDGSFGGAFSGTNGDGGAGGPAAAHGDLAGAELLLKQFVAPNADQAALTKSLRPTSNDYKAMFD